jgi:DNA-binding response OmpR family regulator
VKILIVEDDPGIVEVLDYALRRDGHELEFVARGEEGVRRSVWADFIVLDVGLPDMDGFEVCRQIRRQSEVPILFLTSRSEEVDRVVGLEIGGDDYLAKPFSTRELTARTKAVARRSKTAALPVSLTMREVGGLRLDTEFHRAFWQEGPLDLTPLEFALLDQLMQQPGRVFTRSQLLDHVWPDGGCVTERTVDAHVKSLRRKLAPCDLVETVRGVGYRLGEGAS